jgi:hypothetical protein
MPDPNRYYSTQPHGLADDDRLGRPFGATSGFHDDRPPTPFGLDDERVLLAGPPVNINKWKKYYDKAKKIKDYYERAKKLIDPETRPLALFDELFNLAVGKLVDLFGKGIKDHPFFKYHETHFKVLRQALKDVGTLDAAENALEAAEETVAKMQKESHKIFEEGQRSAKGREHLKGYDRIKEIRLSIWNQVQRKSYDVLGVDIHGKGLLWHEYLLQLKWEIMEDSLGPHDTMSHDDLQEEIDVIQNEFIPGFMDWIESDCDRAVDIALELAGRLAVLSAYMVAVERYLDVYEKKLKELAKSSAIGEIMADNKRKEEQLRFKSLMPGADRVRKNAREIVQKGSGSKEVSRWIAFAAECRSGDILLYNPDWDLQWPWDTVKEYPLGEE